MTRLINSAIQCKTWLSDLVLPLWAEKGYCESTGVFEEGLLSRTESYKDDEIRFRVQPRQIYVYSHASELGLFDSKGIVDNAVKNGLNYFKLNSGGYCFSVNKSLEHKDTSLNAYEHAFAMLGFAWHYYETREVDSLAKAESCYQWFENAIADNVNGGYFSTYPSSSLRSQNPHMHLFEALMTLYEVSDDLVWLKRANKIYDLFCTKFFEGKFLREFFAEDFSSTHIDSENLDPGHHYEWVWLLSHYNKLTGVDVSFQVEALLKFAKENGHSDLGLVMDEIKDDGNKYRTTSRLWCQTELLKAKIAVYEANPTTENENAVSNVVDLIFKYYISPAEDGLWIDQVQENGLPVSTKSPASTLYHIFLAFSELIRVSKLS